MPSVRSQPGAGQRAPRDELSRRLAGCTVTGDKRSARLVSLIGIFPANLAPLPFEIRQFFGWIGADDRSELANGLMCVWHAHGHDPRPRTKRERQSAPGMSQAKQPSASDDNRMRYRRIAPVYDLLELPFEYTRYRPLRRMLFAGLSGRILDA